MTEIKNDDKIVRKTQIGYRGTTLVATLYPKYVNIREFNRRDPGVNVSYDAIYELGLKRNAREQNAQGD